MGPKNHVIAEAADPSKGRGRFWGKMGQYNVMYRDDVASVLQLFSNYFEYLVFIITVNVHTCFHHQAAGVPSLLQNVQPSQSVDLDQNHVLWQQLSDCFSWPAVHLG